MTTTTPPTTYLTNRQFAAAKAALTRAMKKGPEATLDEVAKRFAVWDAQNVAYPDDWHRWNRAADDAQLMLAYGRTGPVR